MCIDWVQESFGIIYNKQLLEKAGYKAEDINSFDKLKACADDIQARKDELGVEGAFTSAGMDDSSSWRYTTHLANMPLYYEFEKEHNQEDDEIKGEFLDNYKQIFDLYITDSTCDPSQLASKTGDDATNEFATGKAVFYQNGSWAYSDLVKAGMTDDQIGMMPIYIGVDGEENQGLCSGGENYWCVSSQASEDAQKATEDFMYWCVTSDTPTSIIADKMGPDRSVQERQGDHQRLLAAGRCHGQGRQEDRRLGLRLHSLRGVEEEPQAGSDCLCCRQQQVGRRQERLRRWLEDREGCFRVSSCCPSYLISDRGRADVGLPAPAY